MSRSFIITTFLFFLAVTVVFGWPLLFGGQALAGGDIIHHYLPSSQLVRDVLSQGDFPHWNPLTFGGRPLQADIQIGLFYPPKVLAWLLPLPTAFDLMLLLHLLFGMLGMALWMRSFTRSWAGPCMAAIVYQMSGFALVRLFSGIVLFPQTMAWLPWMLYCWDRFRRADQAAAPARGLWWAGAVLTVSGTILSGSPQIAFYLFLIFITYVAISEWTAWKHSEGQSLFDKIRPGFFLISILALGALITMVQLLPTRAFIQQSWDRAAGAEWDYITGNSPSWRSLFLQISPWFFGDPGMEAIYWGPQGYHEVTAYTGAAPLFLLLLYLLGRWTFLKPAFAEATRRQGALEKTCLLLLLASLLLVGGKNSPFFWLAYHLIPGFDRFREPGRLMLPGVFALAGLAGLMFEALQRESFSIKRKTAWLGISGLLAGGLGGLLILYVFLPQVFAALHMPFLRLMHQQPAQAGYWQGVIDLLLSIARSDLVRFMILWTIAGALVLLALHAASRPRLAKYRPLWLSVLLILTTAEALLFGWRCMDRVPEAKLDALFYPETERVKYLKNTLATGERFLWYDSVLDYRFDQFQPELLTNHPIMHGLPVLRGYDPVNSKRYGLFMNQAFGLPLSLNPLGQMHMPDIGNDSIDYALLACWNAPVHLSYAQIEKSQMQTERTWSFENGKATLRAYRQTNTYGPAFLRDPLFVSPQASLEQQAFLLQSPAFDPARQALVTERVLSDKAGSEPLGEEKVQVISRGPGTLVLQVETPRPRLLVVAESFYPGWRVRVNGETRRVVAANVAQLGVAIPAGQSKVELRYHPQAFTHGLLISLPALLLCVLVAFRLRRQD